jgi:protoporphyrinogen oxidase
MENKSKKALIIGGGPGGLTAGYELLKRSHVKPIIIERDSWLGGISRTAVYKGNRIDMGGHRFFSKSERVMNWWFNILPIEKGKEDSQTIQYHNAEHTVSGQEKSVDPELEDRVMLVRQRKSRIYYNKEFFEYPLKLSVDTFRKLGLKKLIRIGVSYVFVTLFPKKNPQNLEDFYINQFGHELYRTFFESYTEKVWGKPCRDISAEWGAQRVKGVSLKKAILDFFLKKFSKNHTGKNVETSLIEQFFYPKFGPGQMWEEVAKDIEGMGGTILMEHELVRFATRDGKIVSARVRNVSSGAESDIDADYFFSTMPIKELLTSMEADIPEDVQYVGTNLEYRDFLTVGVLLKKLDAHEPDGSLIRDNWIYIQEPGVKMGRIQIFNNWSPYLVKDKDTVWVGLEYFATEGDALWNLNEEELKELGIKELVEMGLAKKEDVIDSVVIKIKKTYPGYFGTYKDFGVVRTFIDQFSNLFLIGRNGMHKYNNQDHSMLTAMTAVDNIIAGRIDKANIWEINTEEEYHETSKKNT